MVFEAEVVIYKYLLAILGNYPSDCDVFVDGDASFARLVITIGWSAIHP
jgi:hypothetical protein